MRKKLEKNKEIKVLKNFSAGFVNMIRLYPEDEKNDIYLKDLKKENLEIIIKINNYNKKFFEWYYNYFKKDCGGIEFSYSSSFFKINKIGIHCLKFYPVSPHFNRKSVEETISFLLNLKKTFDDNVWKRYGKSL